MLINIVVNSFTERIDMIKKGLIPLIMLSPESLFSGSWRDLVLSAPYQHHLHTIVIDECHCVEEWLVLVSIFLLSA